MLRVRVRKMLNYRGKKKKTEIVAGIEVGGGWVGGECPKDLSTVRAQK